MTYTDTASAYAYAASNDGAHEETTYTAYGVIIIRHADGAQEGALYRFPCVIDWIDFAAMHTDESWRTYHYGRGARIVAVREVSETFARNAAQDCPWGQWAYHKLADNYGGQRFYTD